MGEKKKRKIVKGFFRRSMEFRRSEFVEPKTKVHCLNEGYAWVSKMRDFTKDPKEEIWENQSFSGLGGVLETSFGSTTLK